MSSTTPSDRLPLAYAQQVARTFIERLRPVTHDLEVVGSVRRQRPDVGDIELIAPLPAAGQPDLLFDALAQRFPAGDGGDDDGLFTPTRKVEPWGVPSRGLREGFKAASLLLQLKSPRERVCKVEVYRYTAGPAGNYGWIKILRTGSADFGQALLTLINDRHRGHSLDGFLTDSQGRKLRQDTEEAVFELAGVEYVPPEHRDLPVRPRVPHSSPTRAPGARSTP